MCSYKTRDIYFFKRERLTRIFLSNEYFQTSIFSNEHFSNDNTQLVTGTGRRVPVSKLRKVLLGILRVVFEILKASRYNVRMCQTPPVVMFAISQRMVGNVYQRTLASFQPSRRGKKPIEPFGKSGIVEPIHETQMHHVVSMTPYDTVELAQKRQVLLDVEPPLLRIVVSTFCTTLWERRGRIVVLRNFGRLICGGVGISRNLCRHRRRDSVRFSAIPIRVRRLIRVPSMRILFQSSVRAVVF